MTVNPFPTVHEGNFRLVARSYESVIDFLYRKIKGIDIEHDFSEREEEFRRQQNIAEGFWCYVRSLRSRVLFEESLTEGLEWTHNQVTVIERPIDRFQAAKDMVYYHRKCLDKIKAMESIVNS